MNDIQQMCLDHFNEPVLMMFELCRLIGYGEDADDCYLIVKYPKYPDGRIVWSTAVGGYTFLERLKGQNFVVPAYPQFKNEYWDDFIRLDNVLALSGVPKEEKFIVDVRPEETSFKDRSVV